MLPNLVTPCSVTGGKELWSIRMTGALRQGVFLQPGPDRLEDALVPFLGVLYPREALHEVLNLEQTSF